MLVLTRHAGEQIVIDGNIIVTVVALEGNKIRLGIQAPKSVRVDRAEIHNRRLTEQTAAASATETLRKPTALDITTAAVLVGSEA